MTPESEKSARPTRHFRALGKDVLTYGVMSAVSQFGGLLLLPLLTRALSVDQYGAVDVIATFVSLLSIALKLALPNALTRYFNEVSSPQERSELISTYLLFVSGVGAVVTLAVLPFAGLIAHALLGSAEYGVFVRLGCIIALLGAATSVPQNALRMQRRILAYNVPTFMYTVLYVALVLLFVFGLHASVLGIFVAQVLASAALLVVSLALVRRDLAIALSRGHLKRGLRYGFPMLPSLLSVWVTRQIDRLILLAFVGLGGVALLGAANRIVNVVGFPLAMFQLGWMPYAMIIIKSPERNDVYRRAFNYFAGGFAILGLALTAVSPEVFRLLLPAEYHDAYVIVPWLIGGAVVSDTSQFTRLGMQVSERTAGISVASWLGVVVNVVLAVVLIKLYGLAGAAVGWFAGSLVFTACLWRYSIRLSDVRFDTRLLAAVLAIYSAFSIVMLAAARMMEDALSTVCRIGLLLVAAGLIGYMTTDSLLAVAFRDLSRRLRLVFQR